MTRMPSRGWRHPPLAGEGPPEANRTDITEFTKEKEKRSKKERENVLRRRCSILGRGGLVLPLKAGTLLTQVGPDYSPMWVPFTRRLPPGLPTGFTWHGDSFEIVEQLAAWKQSSREGARAQGDLYLRRHCYRLRMSDETTWVVYFVLQTPRSGNPKTRWFLYAIERDEPPLP